MANKLKTLVLGTALTLSALVSCKDSVQESEPKQPQQPKTEIKTNPKSEQKISKEYYLRVRDSIETVNGAKKYNAQYLSKPASWTDENEIYDLQYDYSLGGVMDREVGSKGIKIVNNAYKQIVAELAKYKVSLDESITQDEGTFYVKVNYLDYWDKKNEYTAEVSKFNLCFIGAGQQSKYDDDYSMADEEWKDLYQAIVNAVEASDCSEYQKNSMKIKTSHIIEKAQRNLIASRKSVEAAYADYMLLPEDFQETMGINYEGEGSYSYGYGDLNAYNNKYLNTRRYISVYDSKLNIDFFGEENATYELVLLKENTWQVIKKSADGTITKTHVFEDRQEFSNYPMFSDEPLKIGETDFRFSPGYNFGVHVISDQVVDVQRRKKDWNMKLPKDVQYTVDSLCAEIAEKQALENKMYAAYHEADSIAKVLTYKKYGKEY